MQKFLRTLMLMAVMLLPFASHAQQTLTVADGTATNSNVPVHGLYVDDYTRCQIIYPANDIVDAASSVYMTGGSISSLTFYLSSPAAASWGDANFEVKLMEVSATTLSAFVDASNATTVYTGSLDGTQSTMTITFTTPYTYQGGNLLLEINNNVEGTYKSASFYGVNATGASWQGYSSTSVAAVTGSAKNFMPKTTFTFTGGTQVTCPPVENLVATNITSTSAELFWSGNASGYTVYEYANVDSNGFMTADTFFTFNTLEPNTVYTFGVVSDCGADGESVMRSVSFRTACSAMSALPFTEDFETVPAGSYQMPFCWNRYTSAFTTAATYPYSYSGNAHGGSRSLYFYGATTAAYPDTMVAILPELDVVTYPMNGNRLTFWAKMGAASNIKKVYVGTVTNPADPTTFTMIDSVTVSGNTYTLHSVALTNAAATDPYVAMVVLKGTGSMYIDDVTLEEMPSCLEISNLAAGNITSSSVDLSWNDPSNSGATYTIYNMNDTSIVASAVDVLTYTVTGLNPNTNYIFGVQANCPAGDAAIMTVSALTACASETMPWSETFDNWTAKSPCWQFLSGQLNGGAGTPTASTSAWALNTTYGSYITISGKALTMNLYSTNRYWAVTPFIDITSNDAMLSVDVAVSAWSAEAPNYDDNDTLAFAVTTDGTTWTVLRVVDYMELNTMGGTYTTVNVPVSGYNGQSVRFAIYGGSISGTSPHDNRIAIDNVTVGEVPSCMPVIGLTASNITTDAATLSWTGDAASYNVYAIATDTTFVQNVATTTFDLTGLTAMTQYTYGVTSVCGSDESSMVTVTFATACSALTLPYVETFEANSATIGCWTTDGPGSWTIGTGDYSASTGAFEGTTNAKITHGITGNVTKLISPMLDGVTDGLLLDFAYVMRAWSSDIDELRVYSRSSDTAAWQQVAEYTNAAEVWTVQNLIIPGTVYQVAFEYTDNYGYGVGIDSVAFTPMSSSFCYPVTDLTVDSVTATSIFLSWTDADNSGATYTIMGANGTVVATGVSGTSYEVTGLTASTNYTFGVTADCSATESSNVVTISALTDCVNGSCLITIVGTDSYGDGWNGNAINVMQAGVVIGTFTLTSGSSATETFTVCSGAPVSFEWVLGSYATETSFEIKDGGGMVVYTCADGSTLTEGAAFYTLTDACPSCIPAAVTVDAATETSVTISWTGTAASYDVYNGTTLVTSTTANTYTFTGLTHSTTYTFGVQAICSATDTAAMTIVTVATACADVTTLPYMEGFESGLGCWTTVNGSADGMPWYALNEASYAHTGTGFAVSFSYYNYTSMHADAWLISPKFVLPTVNAGDTLNFSWWYQVDAGYPLDLYDVMLSTTTNDTAAFTTTLLAVTPDSNNGEYTQMLVDLTAYAGQSIYLAFHHHDSYDQDFLMIDDIFMGVGAAPVPDPDSMQVNVAVNDPTMGTTNPAPGTHYFHVGEAASVVAVPNDGYHLTGWTVNLVAGGITLVDTTYNYAFDDVFDLYGGWIVEEGDDAVVWTVTANFAAGAAPVMHDSVTVITSVNDTTMGTVTPAPGTHYYVMGDTILIGGIQPNPGYYVYALQMTVSHPILDTITDETITDTAILAEMVGMYDTLIVDEESMMGMIVTFNVIFAAEGAAPQTYTVEVAYDITKGTVTGADTYVAGVNVTLTAIAYEGYTFVAWVEGNDTVGRNTVYTIANIDADHYLTAVFAVASTGIEDVDMENVNIYSTNDKIVVRGAEGKQVVLFDVNGRVLSREANATEQVEFRVYNSGVYLVKVNNAAAKRVVVVR